MNITFRRQPEWVKPRIKWVDGQWNAYWYRPSVRGYRIDFRSGDTPKAAYDALVRAYEEGEL